MELPGRQRRFLRALGHHLKPELLIGKQGVTPALIRQLEHCLLAHELVKVKLLESSPAGRDEAGRELAAASGSGLAQTLGRTLLLYRPHPEEPKIELPS
jgi:RNA-binding protein